METNIFEKLLIGLYGIEPGVASEWVRFTPILAAEKLDMRQYAAYRVMQDNPNLLDVLVLADGKFRTVTTAFNNNDPHNTVGKILWSSLGYTLVRGANMLVSETIKKLLGILVINAGKPVAQTETGIWRMSLSTQNVLDHQLAQSNNPFKDKRVAIDLIVPINEDPLHQFRSFNGRMALRMPLKMKRKTSTVNIAEMIGDSDLDAAVFRYNGIEYKKSDFIVDFKKIIDGGSLTADQKSALSSLNPEYQNHLKHLTGFDIAANLENGEW